MKRFTCIAALLLSTVCFAGQGMGPGPGVKGYATASCGSPDISGFETNLDGWTNAGTGGITFGRTSTDHHGGSYSINASGIAYNAGYAKITKSLTTCTGQTMTFWLNIDQGAIDYFGQVFHIDITAGGSTTTYTPSGGGWQQVSKTITTGQSETVAIKCYGDNDAVDGTINFTIDDISVPVQ